MKTEYVQEQIKRLERQLARQTAKLEETADQLDWVKEMWTRQVLCQTCSTPLWPDGTCSTCQV